MTVATLPSPVWLAHNLIAANSRELPSTTHIAIRPTTNIAHNNKTVKYCKKTFASIFLSCQAKLRVKLSFYDL